MHPVPALVLIGLVLAKAYKLEHGQPTPRQQDGIQAGTLLVEGMPYWHPQCGQEPEPPAPSSPVLLSLTSEPAAPSPEATALGAGPGNSNMTRETRGCVAEGSELEVSDSRPVSLLTQLAHGRAGRSYRRRIVRRRRNTLCTGFEESRNMHEFQQTVNKRFTRSRDRDPPGLKDIADYGRDGIGAHMYELAMERVMYSAFFEMQQWQAESAQLWMQAVCADSPGEGMKLSCEQISQNTINASSPKQFTQDVLIEDCQLKWQTQPWTLKGAMQGMMNDVGSFLDVKFGQVRQNLWFKSLYPLGEKQGSFCRYLDICKTTRFERKTRSTFTGTPFPTSHKVDVQASQKRCLALPECGGITCDESGTNCELYLEDSNRVAHNSKTSYVRIKPDYSSETEFKDAQTFMDSMCPWFKNEVVQIQDGNAQLPVPECLVTREHEVKTCSAMQEIKKETCAAGQRCAVFSALFGTSIGSSNIILTGLMLAANRRQDMVKSELAAAHSRAISRRKSIFSTIMDAARCCNHAEFSDKANVQVGGCLLGRKVPWRLRVAATGPVSAARFSC